jgi:ribonuclease HII
MALPHAFRVGVDENGLGARLGPLVVTAVLAEVDDRGTRVLSRKPPPRLRSDLGDSKELVSHSDYALGEAWGRAVIGDGAGTPHSLFEELSLEGTGSLMEPCPERAQPQCWSSEGERFTAEAADVARLRGHLSWWAERGVRVRAVKSSVVCTKQLNAARGNGGNRFVSDLHAMERLVLRMRETAGSDLLAVCGKVGGINDYSKFFGPLSHRLHSVLEAGRAVSSYNFPGVGEVRFVRDADDKDALVMLASIVGKYVRELLMARVAGFYRESPESPGASGYHDPVTARFVLATALQRRHRGIPNDCFERARDEA